MKKLLLFFFLIYSFNQFTKANHWLGGEISWECLPNGKYVFKSIVYIDCQGVGINFQNETLFISGNPLPRDSNNRSLSSIILKPDSSKFLVSNEISPQCDTNGANQINCTSMSSIGSVQKYHYVSDPIELNGIAPSSGWNFRVLLVCCRGSYRNLARPGGQIIGSTMYSHNGGACNDNSPIFSQNPDFVFYKNTPNKLNEGVMDFDGDSLVYEYSNTYDNLPNAPQVLPFTSSFALNNNGNSMGQDFFINRMNGSLSFVDTTNFVQPVYAVRKVSAYRNGLLISENYRESHFDFLNSPPINNKPTIRPPFFKGGSTFSFKDTINAGDFIAINLSVQDTNRINGIPQEIRVQVISDAIAKDYTFNGVCTNPRDTNCAYITSAAAVYNTQRDGYEIRRTGVYSGQIRWQSDCSDLDSLGGPRTHFFVIRAQDDLCPIPGLAYETVEVTVLPPAITPCPLITSVDKEKSIKDKLSIYPNPTNGQINIQSGLEGELNLKVFNIRGQLVKEEKLLNENNQIEIEGKGLYFISIFNQKGERANFKILNQ